MLVKGYLNIDNLGSNTDLQPDPQPIICSVLHLTYIHLDLPHLYVVLNKPNDHRPH